MVALPLFKEDLLQFIWEQQLFRREALRTSDGKTLEVLRPGRLHTDSGPDLLDARLRIDGHIMAGTIEVHLNSSEWYAHGHDRDPAYDNVILHVVYEHDMAIRTSCGGRVPTLELKSRIAPGSIAAYQGLMKNKAWVPCEERIAEVDPARVELWLERVLIERLERKTKEVEVLFHELGNDRAETFWRMLARGFGSKVNAEPFGMLAQALPLKILQKYRDDPFRTEALLFGQAGLLQTDLLDEHPRAMQSEYTLLAQLHGLRPMSVAAWKFARMHPPNFPTVRIAQLARLVMKCDGGFSELIATDDLDVLRARLEVVADGYWAGHYRFDQASPAAPKRFGRDAADHLIINSIVPYRFAMARLHGDEDAAQRTLELLERLPAESNVITRKWEGLGLGATNAARSQALIELKNVRCTGRMCLSCGIGIDLLKRTAP